MPAPILIPASLAQGGWGRPSNTNKGSTAGVGGVSVSASGLKALGDALMRGMEKFQAEQKALEAARLGSAGVSNLTLPSVGGTPGPVSVPPQGTPPPPPPQVTPRMISPKPLTPSAPSAPSAPPPPAPPPPTSQMVPENNLAMMSGNLSAQSRRSPLSEMSGGIVQPGPESLIPQRNMRPGLPTAIQEVARQYNLSPLAVAAMINTESKFDPSATSPGGRYVGLSQIGPDDLQAMGYSKQTFPRLPPEEQVRAYGQWLDLHKFNDRNQAAGVDVAGMNPSQQAAFLQANQFAPNAQGWRQNFDVASTNAPQAGALGGMYSVKGMTPYYDKMLSQLRAQPDYMSTQMAVDPAKLRTPVQVAEQGGIGGYDFQRQPTVGQFDQKLPMPPVRDIQTRPTPFYQTPGQQPQQAPQQAPQQPPNIPGQLSLPQIQNMYRQQFEAAKAAHQQALQGRNAAAISVTGARLQSAWDNAIKSLMPDNDLQMLPNGDLMVTPKMAPHLRYIIQASPGTQQRQIDFGAGMEAGKTTASEIAKGRVNQQYPSGNPAYTVDQFGRPTATPGALSQKDQFEIQETQRKLAEREGQKEKYGNVVLQDIDRAIDAAATGTWTTGAGGTITQYIPGTSGHDLSRILDGIKANIGFSRLQEMREASPTGGAVGQVSNFEQGLLQSVFGSVAQSQSRDQFIFNMRRLHNVMLDTIHGKPEHIIDQYNKGRIDKQTMLNLLSQRWDLPPVPSGAPQIQQIAPGIKKVIR